MTDSVLLILQNHFGERLQQNVSLSRHTTAQVGGPARWFAESVSSTQLASDVQFLWESKIPCRVLGNGSNLLISDSGWDGFVLLNKSKEIHVSEKSGHSQLFTASGVVLNTLVRTTITEGLSGLEWAAGIPGTVGGAVYGNAGAHGQIISQILVMAEILHREKGLLSLSSDQMGYSYRSSALKKEPGTAVILSATFKLVHSSSAAVQAMVDEMNEKRRTSQPTGASLGSTFKNPTGEHAGHLIEAAGLKGKKIGGVEVSSIHANFFVNDGTATAQDYRQLIQFVQNVVQEKFGVLLETEIEFFGDWMSE